VYQGHSGNCLGRKKARKSASGSEAKTKSPWDGKRKTKQDQLRKKDKTSNRGKNEGAPHATSGTGDAMKKSLEAGVTKIQKKKNKGSGNDRQLAKRRKKSMKKKN